jgi:septal ring factor EnvC (AmiA/AmiB activator)
MQLPQGVSEWMGEVFKLAGTVLTLGLAVWGILKARVALDINVRRDIDGVGKRVKALETSCTQMTTQITALERQLAEARARDDAFHSRLGAVEEAQRSVADILRQAEQNLTSRVQEIKEALTGESARQRERIVRLETMSELRTKGLLKQEVEDA